MLEFASFLPVPTGPLQGQRISLDGFQEDFVRAIYRPQDAAGHRLVQQAVLSTARRNGKSLLMALFVLTHLAGPARRLNSMMLSGANDRFQAAVVFDHIAAIIMMEPRLAFLNVIQSTKRIFNPRTNSVYIAISAEAVTKLGRGPEVVVYDELGSARNRQLYDVLVSGQGATLDPLMVNISTQAQARTHLFSELIDYGAKVATGEIRDPSFVCHLHAAQPGCSLLDEREWKKANPALGKWRSMTEMRTKAQQASLLPSLEPMFRNLYLNQRVDSISPMIPPMIWDACGGAPELKHFAKRSVYGGLDLSTKNDLSALALVCRDEEGLVHALVWFWTPDEGLKERAQRDAAPYAQWVDQKLLTTTPGRVIDYGFIVKELARATTGMSALEAINYDRWGIERFKKEADDQGCTFPLIPCGQGFKDMAPCVSALEDLLLSEKLRHGGHAVLTMCASNAVAETNPVGQRKFTKAKSTGRIDGVVALAMACGALANAENSTPQMLMI